MSQCTSAISTNRCLVAGLVGSGFPFMWISHSIYHKLRLDAVGRVWQESNVHSCGGVRPIAKATTGCRGAGLVGFGLPVKGMTHVSCTELRLDAVLRVRLDLDVAFVCDTLSPCTQLRLDASGWVGFYVDVIPLVSDHPPAKQTETECLGVGLMSVGCALMQNCGSNCKNYDCLPWGGFGGGVMWLHVFTFCHWHRTTTG